MGPHIEHYSRGGILLRSVFIFNAAFLVALTNANSCLASQQTNRASAVDQNLPSASSPESLPLPVTISYAAISQDPIPPKITTSSTNSANDPSASTPDSPQPKVNAGDDSAKQTKRILWIVPNFRSVSADAQLPRLGVKEKFCLATQESFDYSAVTYSGLLAGGAMASKSEPAFGQGASGYGNYFAHTFADGTIENYMVEAVVPTLTKQDPRYYTLGHGGFFKRTGYAVSRLFITRTDSGNPTPNLSELVGAGAAAGISNTYYFDDTNVWVKTYQRWLSQMVQDAVSNIAKEFWPDINRAVFRNRY
jgi:hypothetical protein